MTSQRVDE
jgi:hypothetical protein